MQKQPSLPLIVADAAVPRVSAMGAQLRVFPALSRPVDVAQAIAMRHTLQDDDRAFFVVNYGRVVEQWLQWQRLLPRVEVFYAVKCNNDHALLRLLATLGAGFDCASKNEIDQVLSMGLVGPDKIIYANPCKTRNYIRHAKACDVKMMTFDNLDELNKVHQLFPDAELVLRIRLMSDTSAQCPLNVKFGCDPENVAPQLLQAAAALGHSVVGISFHVGSGCHDANAYDVAISHARQLFELGRALGHPMALLDLGGGYPGFDTDVITFPEIAQVINRALDVYFPSEYGARVIAEPGRYFAAGAFSLVCSVMAKTRVPASRITKDDQDADYDGFMYYINDGVYGSFNCVLYDHFHPTGKPLFNNDGAECTWATVWGPTCDGLDQVVEQCRLPTLTEGDWMLFDNMGAYTCAAGSEFNGFERPLIYYYITADHWSSLSSLLELEECDEQSVCESESETDESVIDESELCSSLGSVSSYASTVLA